MSLNIKSRLICGIIIFIVLFGTISLADFDSSQLQWAGGVSDKLMRGQVISYKGYTVQAVDFPAPVESAKYKPEPAEPVEPFVALNISKNGSFISTVALGLAESYTVPDGELKVTANELPSPYAKEWIFESYAPWAVVELDPRGTPSLEVSIQTDKDKYTSSYTTDITATVNLKNKGTADAFNVDMVIDTELPINRGRLKYHYDRIKTGESITETITFASPILEEQKMFSISADVSGYDVMNIPYTATTTKSISMAAELPVILSISKSTVNKMYLKDYTIISLSVKNNGRLDAKNVNITDSLPGGFKLLGNQSLHWVADIPVNEEWDFRYLVRPLEANKEGVLFPAATAEFEIKNESYSMQSNQPRIVVYGPKIILKKRTDVSEFNPGDTVTVTVVAENTGSTPTRVTIIDTLPDNVTLVSGSTMGGGFLEATMNMSFSYTLRIDSKETITLPAANAEYYELGSMGRKISTSSQEVEIQLKSARKTPIPTPQITTQTPVPTPQTTASAPEASPTVIVPTATELHEIGTLLLNTILGCNDINIGSFKRTVCDYFEQGIGEPQANISIRKSTVDSMLLKDYTSISLYVVNNGTYDAKNVNITDSLPDDFILIGNQSLHWVVDIPAGSEREYRYLVRPEESSKEGIVFPAASAEFEINNKLYSIRSNQPTIVINGPKVVLTKQADVSELKPLDNVTVTVLAENTGTVPTSLAIQDNLPEYATLVNGSTRYEGFLEANSNVSFSYTLKIDSNQTVLPPAIAAYYEFGYKGRKLSTRSQELEIPIKSPTKIIEAPGKKISEAEFLQLGYFLIALGLVSFVLYKLWSYRKTIKAASETTGKPEEQRKYEEAIKAYDKAIEINPENADAWYNKGFALYELGKNEEATKAYDTARKIIQRNKSSP